MKFIGWLLVGFLAIALGNKFIRGDGTKKVGASNSAPAAEEVSKLGESQLGKVFISGDWAQTLPGQAIENSLGVGWANWVIWGVIAIVILSVVVNYLPATKKKDGGSIFFGVGVTMIVLLLIGILTVTVKNWMDAPKANFQVVDMMTLAYGESVTIPMGLSTIALPKVHGTVQGKDQHSNYACPEAKKLNGLFPAMFEVVNPFTENLQIKHSEETKRKLIEANMATVYADVTFTLTKGPMFGPSPCKHVVK